jgi:peptidoglycan/LPS O-acetylase OafA/YrhL
MKYRAEIDGLRALAVLPVILFHAGFEWFSGGFVGVDVFFVISGYLITTIIIFEMAEGKFSIVNFYERRARRILPALFFVMSACLPFAWFWLTPNDLKDFGQSLIAVSTFSSNILFWLESGYFDTAAELKPLLHTWSLAVEEQYYILFPIFLMLTWHLGIKWILIFLSIVFFISLGVAHWSAHNFSSAAFYLLPTRGWELLVGVFAAFYLKYNTHLKSHNLNQALSLLGFGMILYSILVFDKTTPFPSLYTLIPTIGTGLLILCAVPKTFVHNLLSLKFFVGIGLISYSAYLWHQPLLAFARHRFLGELPELILINLCFISLAMAWLSWRFIERPFRNKLTHTRNNIFIFSFIGIILFTSSGLFLHVKDGFRDVKNESTYKYLSSIGLKKYELNNEKLKNDSWKILREIYKNENYDVDNNISDASNNFIPSSSAKRVLIVGNSHSKDLFNVFFHSKDIVKTLNIARYGIQVKDINYKFYSSDAYLNSQAIVLVSRYDKRDLLALYDVAKKIIADKKTLFITEEIFNFPTFGSYTLADHLVMKKVRDNASSTKDLIELINMRYTNFFVENSSTKQFYNSMRIYNVQKTIIENEFSNVIFLNRNDYVCPNDYCYGVTPDGVKTFYDYGHHTIVGSKFFGENLKNTKFYRDLLIGLEK